MAASSQTTATQAAIRILDAGGTAVDAAIAANAVLCVTEPMMCGIGGDLMALVWEEKSQSYYGLNGSGWAPNSLTAEKIRSAGYRSMPKTGAYTVTVPGCVFSWKALHARFGRLDWSKLFKDAIALAEHGFVVPEVAAALWVRDGARKQLNRNTIGAGIFLNKDGKAFRAGMIHRNRPMGVALRMISQNGIEALTSGPVGKAVASACQAQGGCFEVSDFASFAPEWVEPVSLEYRGVQVHELPPNTLGPVVLEQLGILSNFASSAVEMDDPGTLHREIEAMKLAYDDAIRKIADPRFVLSPTNDLFHETHTSSLADKIRGDSAMKIERGRTPISGDTVYLATADRDGNMVGLIQSIFWSWGSSIFVEDFGFALHNRGSAFSLSPRNANYVMPYKRPLHTLVPGFLDNKRFRMAFGVMGGLNQPMAHMQFVVNVVDRRMNPQLALDSPRFTSSNAPFDKIFIESRLAKATSTELKRLGHHVIDAGPWSLKMGRGQAILKDLSSGTYFGASDPRGDGCALGVAPDKSSR